MNNPVTFVWDDNNCWFISLFRCITNINSFCDYININVNDNNVLFTTKLSTDQIVPSIFLELHSIINYEREKNREETIRLDDLEKIVKNDMNKTISQSIDEYGQADPSEAYTWLLDYLNKNEDNSSIKIDDLFCIRQN